MPACATSWWPSRRRAASGWPILIALVVWGCASGPGWQGGDAQLASCIDAYRAIDTAVIRAGVRDAEASRVGGFPHLRTSRFLASFSRRDLSDAAFEAWVQRMAALDWEARSIELMNLPPDRRSMLDGRLRASNPVWSDAEAAVWDCANRLVAATVALGPDHDGLRQAVVVPDDYSVLARTLGLYPLSAIPVALGYQRWQSLNLPAFDVPLSRISPPAVVYRPHEESPVVTAAQARDLLADAARRNPLGVPELEREELQALAAAFAPALLVEVRDDADLIGHPRWRTDGLPEIDPERPVAFVRLEHAWFDRRPIAQLVYLFWFDERPAKGAVDLLAGRLDGLIWRVSLDRDGRPIVYDTIHACGCYHLFFPAPGTSTREVPENRPGDPRDPVLVPMRAELDAPDQRAVVRIASGSHYVTGVGALDRLDHVDGEAVSYALVIEDPPDLSLRSLPAADGARRSLYRPDGIVAGTERGERALLWPMGILEPGAMRQWGRHAVAFVGERHFDDPHLIERAFAR